MTTTEASQIMRQAEAEAVAVEAIVARTCASRIDQIGLDCAAQEAIELSQHLDLSLGQYFQLCLLLEVHDPAFVNTKVYFHYVTQDGHEQHAFERAILYCGQRQHHAGVLSCYRRAERWFKRDDLPFHLRFFVAVAFTERGEPEKALTLYLALLAEHPSSDGCLNNLRTLARDHHLPDALAFYEAESAALARLLPDLIQDVASEPPAVISLSSGPEAIARSLNHHGLCHIKNGCREDVLRALLDSVRSQPDDRYPKTLCPEQQGWTKDLFLFDADQIIADALQVEVAVDFAQSVIRKVDPSDDDSLTPFHQDTTAFRKMLVNIWAPMTPAGGDYPTLQLVKKRIRTAEQTMLRLRNYQLVAIDEAHVLSHYGDCLFEPPDVQPGDCVIFFGTTIHRSVSLKSASKTRYNLEMRCG